MSIRYTEDFYQQSEPIGEEGNAWNNQSTGINGDSSSVDLEYNAFVDIVGNTSGATELTIYKSQDDTKFYDSEVKIEIEEAGDFAINGLYVGFRYIRLQSSNDVTATATIAAKA